MCPRDASGALLAALACVLGACSAAPTQLVVVVDTDIPIPSRLDTITIQVTPPSGETQVESSELGSPSSLPMTLGVAPSGDVLGPIRVLALGSIDGTEVARREHHVTLVRGESRMLVLHLAASCASATCGSGYTCSEDGCVTIEVEPEDLPPWPGTPPRLVPTDAGIRDGGPDGGACASDFDCDDGVFCDGDETCVDGACRDTRTPRCAPPTTCDEALNTCVGCETQDHCGPPVVRARGECTYPDACALTGARERRVTRYTCERTICVPTDEIGTEPCTRDTEGVVCMPRTCPTFPACPYAGPCAETATAMRTCTEGFCRMGACAVTMPVETMACTRETTGAVCVPASCMPFEGCYPVGDECAGTGREERWCTAEAVCTAAGTCPRATQYRDARDCVYDSEGQDCGTRTCGAWSGCDWSDTCDEFAWDTQPCTQPYCEGGACTGIRSDPNRFSCSRDTDGTPCDDGRACTGPDACGFGSCRSTDNCGGGSCYCGPAGTCIVPGGAPCP